MSTAGQPETPLPGLEVDEDRSDPFLSPRGGATELYLIRHGDALPGADEVVQGDYNDQGLSELGRRQAAALAAYLGQIDLAAVYSSQIGRARLTAAPLAAALGLEARIAPNLHEVELGPVGATLSPTLTPAELSAALRARLNEIAAIALTTGLWSSIPGSEPAAALRARVTVAINGIAAAHPGARVAIVSHGGVINAYIAEMLGIARDYFFPAANTSVSIVRFKGGRRLLLALNDVSHLRRAGLLPGSA